MTFEDRRLRWLLIAALVLVAAGFYAFVLRGADQPKNPTLGAPTTSTTEVSSSAPGDPNRVPLAGFGEVAITVEPPGAGGTVHQWCLLAALSVAQRSQGLMGVTSLQGYSGMAFVYADDVQHSFFMRNTPIPLTIGWLNKDGGLVSTADMAPCANKNGCPLYSATGPYRMAIEVPQGQLAALGIVAGSHTTITGACGPRSTS